jgi:hypothetical protein
MTRCWMRQLLAFTFFILTMRIREYDFFNKMGAVFSNIYFKPIS